MSTRRERGAPRRPRRAARGFARAARLLLLLVTLVVATASAASAHSTLDRSDPPDGGMVAVGRTTLTLWFGEPLAKGGGSFVLRRSGTAAAIVPTTVLLDEGAGLVRLTTAPLERGTYSLVWGVTAEDGHPTGGTIAFGAGMRPAGAAGPASDLGGPGPDPWGVALRLVDLGGMLVAIGAVAVSGRVLGAMGPTGAPVRTRVLALGTLGALASFVAVGATPWLRARDQSAAGGAGADAWAVLSPDLLLATTWGRLWLLRLATTAVAALALWRVTRDQPGTGVGALAGPGSRPRSVLAVAAVALVGSAGLDSWAGHAATLPARTTVTILAATLHVLAAGVWAGGLVVVLTGIRPVLRLDPRTRRTVPSAAWRAYSPMAAVAAGVLAATGVYEAARHVEGVSTVLSSTYGVAVVVKVLLLAGALVLAGHATLVVNPGIAERVLGSRVAWRPQPRRLARTVAVEAVVLVAAVAVAALMTSVPTARQVTRAAEVSAPAHSTVDGLFVTVESVSTGTSQRLVVRTEPVVRPLLAPVTGVEVGDAGRPGVRPVALSEADPGRYEGMWTDPIEGGWQARVALHREGRPDSVLLVPLTARAGDVTTALELAGSGLAVLLLAGIAWVVVAAARRRGTPRPETVGRPDAGATPRAADLRAGVS